MRTVVSIRRLVILGAAFVVSLAFGPARAAEIQNMIRY
jgi:hypothetical protein